MIRGTTAQFKFELPKRFSELCYIEIKFGQDGNDNASLTKIYDKQYETVTELPSFETAGEKIYLLGTTFYKKNNEDSWEEAFSAEALARNDGIVPKNNDASSYIVVTSLEPGQTKLFSEKRKGWVQIYVHCNQENITMASYEEKFNVYPGRCDISSVIAPVDNVEEEVIVHLDAGEIE